MTPTTAQPAIYIMSPAGAVRDPATLALGAQRLREMGFVVTVDPAADQRYQRFSGTDEARLAAFARAQQQPAPLVMAARGGYGMSRLLHRLDWQGWADSGKRFIGYSDCTAFSLGLLAQTGAGSDAGPMACGDFGAPTLDPAMCQHFLAALRDEPLLAAFDAASAPDQCHEGVLWGGNLALISAMVGTPYLPQIEGGILFLEDVGEAPFRIERMLTQLLHAGILARQRAILLGRFTATGAPQTHEGHDMPAVEQWLRAATRTPVIGGLPHGHVPEIVTLPVGAPVRLAVQGGWASLRRCPA